VRTIEVYDHNENIWTVVDWPTVTSGELVRITEEDGTPITDGTGVYELRVISDAYQQTISDSGSIWTIDIADPDPYPVPYHE